jgi:hypothetical protein
LVDAKLAAGELDPPATAVADCPALAEVWDPLPPPPLLLLLEQAERIKAKTAAGTMRKAALFPRLAKYRCDIASP